MAEDGKIAGAIKMAKDLAEVIPAYQDAVQPAAVEFGNAAKPAGHELGDAVTTIAKVINTALDPLRHLMWGYEKIREYIQSELEERFKNKAEKIVMPSPIVAVPVLESMRYASSEPVSVHTPVARRDGMGLPLLAA